ncbi:MAG: NifB/NifX family molybdenum-iron cluster-binding protein [Bacillota bacterium]|nr:NifB/NifX family molybdenum-iron cluster-binding protein [Bacillota bacterium]HHU60444.1 dinitrogenase iron-molybdenum cofactor [Natronincola sp.]
MKIAVATDKGVIASHFGHCAFFEIFKIEDKKIAEVESITNPGHKPGFLPNFLHELGVDVMIAGGIGSAAVSIFAENGIIVVAGASGQARDVVEKYLEGSLENSGVICEH